MRPLTLALLLIVGLAPPVLAQSCTVVDAVAGYVNAASLSEADVQAAITAAGSTGKTVCLPAGSATWTTPVSNCYSGSTPITVGACSGKWVHIRGAGTMPLVGAATSGGTTITDNIPGAGSAGCSEPTTYCVIIFMGESADGNASLSNLTINTADAYDKITPIAWEATGGVASGTAGAKVMTMHHMTFNDGLTNSNISRVGGAGRGVWYRNKFVRSQDTNGQATFRCSLASGTAFWESARTFGAADTGGDLNFYFENNDVKNYAQSSTDAACRTVYRGNTFENCSLGGHGRDSQNPGAAQMEFYLNRFNCRGSSSSGTITGPVALRGASQYGFNNTFEEHGSNCTNSALSADIRTSIWILVNPDGVGCFRQGGSPGVYPAPQQFGWGYTTGATTVTRDSDAASPYRQDLYPSRYWSNYRPDGTTKITSDGVTADGGMNTFLPSPDTCSDGHLISTFIQENREWYKQNDSYASSPTTGIGIGARASRPATCTAGTAWWATDQGSWNSSGSGGQGVLDVCTATDTWTNAYYTPYPYPHTLATVTGSSSSGSSTAAPRGRARWHGPHAKPDRLETP